MTMSARPRQQPQPDHGDPAGMFSKHRRNMDELEIIASRVRFDVSRILETSKCALETAEF
jgi:hypothetical protein